MSVFIHPMARVDDDVTLGARTKVWQFSSVIRGAVLGNDCSVASNVTIDGSRYGNGCVFRPGVDIGPGVLAGDDVFFGPKITVCNDAWPRTHKLGYDMNELRRSPVVIIEDGASIGAHAAIMPGVRIGANAMIAAGSIVSKDVPPNALWKDGRFSIVPDEAYMLARRIRAAGAERVR